MPIMLTLSCAAKSRITGVLIAIQVMMPDEMLCSGMQAKSSMRLTALNAAITLTPCALMTLWMTALPMGWHAC